MARVKKEDFVQVTTGKYRGQTGRVLTVFPKEGKCIVEKINTVKRHQKAKSQNAPSGIIEKNMKIDLSNVMLFDSKAKRPSRIKMVGQKDTKIRQYVCSGSEVEAAAKK